MMAKTIDERETRTPRNLRAIPIRNHNSISSYGEELSGSSHLPGAHMFQTQLSKWMPAFGRLVLPTWLRRRKL
jgi:hypothetical protein